jgi:hypothetical protein
VLSFRCVCRVEAGVDAVAELVAGRERSSGPFGNPDGARADIADVLSNFVEFTDFGALATEASDAGARVLVGKLGAGKTVYMRRLQSYQSTHDGVYADHPQQDLPSTDLVVRVCQRYRIESLTEKWAKIWHRAILRALASHLLRNRELRDHLSTEESDSLVTYDKLIGAPRQPHSIYSEVRAIINGHNTANHLDRFLEDSLWDDLEYELAEILRGCPPIFFYLDAVDEEFHNAPMYWLRCQQGLFHQTMKMIRDPKFGGRLHVVISIRDIVLSSVFKSEHAPRYHHEPHIRILDWPAESLEVLLKEKIRSLPSSLRLANRMTSPIEAWLGSAWIFNESRQITEPLDDYLLRHTRLIPRDIVSLGNALCDEISSLRAHEISEFPPRLLQRVVSRAAKRFGDSQIAQSANQVGADLMPENASALGFSSSYVGSQEYAMSLQETIKRLIREIGQDEFGREALEKLDGDARAELGEAAHLASVLWQNGLVGYRDGADCVFYSLADIDSFDIPTETGKFVLHPCVLDSVRGLRVAGSSPIRPYRLPT